MAGWDSSTTWVLVSELPCHDRNILTVVAIFSIPGYTLKGLEKEFAKHHLTKLRAEIYLIRLRQGIQDYREASEEEKETVIQRWKLSRCPPAST